MGSGSCPALPPVRAAARRVRAAPAVRYLPKPLAQVPAASRPLNTLLLASFPLPARTAAAEIYYNCSLVAQNEQLYNNLYLAYWGAPSTINDIVSREASRVVRDYLLGLKKDPFMVGHAQRGRAALRHGTID